MWAILFNLLLLAIFSFKMAQAQTPVTATFGADAYVRSYHTQTGSDKKSGFAQMLRVKLDLSPGDGISLKTRTILSGDKWDGDFGTGTTNVTGNSDNGKGGRISRLDYGYLEYMKDEWLFRAGRQDASWADCLTVCDDRRDRLLAMKRFGSTFVFAVYDKRIEGSDAKSSDDGDMYSLLFVHFTAQVESGMLAAYWVNPDGSYVLKDVLSLSPYLKYKNGSWQYKALYHWIGQGDKKVSWYPGHHHAGALHAVYDNEKIKWESQIFHVRNGAFVGTGYDTYLSMVNNNPDYNQSNVQLVRLGGFGTLSGYEKKKDTLISSRGTYRWNSSFSTGLALGALQYYDATAKVKVKQTALDLTATYVLNDYSKVKVHAGRLMGDRYQNAAGAQFELDF